VVYGAHRARVLRGVIRVAAGQPVDAAAERRQAMVKRIDRLRVVKDYLRRDLLQVAAVAAFWNYNAADID
jgi:hypothetical protein